MFQITHNLPSNFFLHTTLFKLCVTFKRAVTQAFFILSVYLFLLRNYITNDTGGYSTLSHHKPHGLFDIQLQSLFFQILRLIHTNRHNSNELCRDFSYLLVISFLRVKIIVSHKKDMFIQLFAFSKKYKSFEIIIQYYN